MDSFDFDMAGLYCQRALDLESTNLQALDLLGHICSELGDTQKAKGISFLYILLCFCLYINHFNCYYICPIVLVVVTSLTESL